MPHLDAMLEEVEDDILKLYCLFSCCLPNKQDNGEDFLSRDYILGKTQRVIQGIPLSLDADAKKMYEEMKKQNIKRRYKSDEEFPY